VRYLPNGWENVLNHTAEHKFECEVDRLHSKDEIEKSPIRRGPGAILPLVLRRMGFFMVEAKGIRAVVDITLVFLWLGLAFLPWQIWYGGKVRLGEALQGVSAAHPLGTDSMGRDMLVRLSGAIQNGVLPLWLAVAMGVLCGSLVALGCLVSGRQNHQRFFIKLVDIVAVILATIPAGVMAFAWGAVRERVDLVGVLWTLGILFAVRMYLLVRDLERRDQNLGYWTTHEALGGTTLSRIWRYGVCGGWSAELLESLSLNLRVAVAIEAAVSYLGFGVTEPAASFGNMLATHFDYYLKGHVGVVMPIILGLGMTAVFPGAFVRMCWRLSRRLS
jgi:peptide/nickel transport system permease protein